MDKARFQKKLGKHIATLRREKGLSQVEFGYMIEMQKQNVNRLENGRSNPTAFTLAKIALALEIPYKEIMNFPA
jgi:putative transcriptional regulator